MKFKVELIDEAREDLKNLDNSQQILVAKQLKQLASNPYKGKRLGNKFGLNLTGFYKLYVAKKRIRIIYTVKEHLITVEVISIGKREESKVYKEAFQRVKKEL